MARFLDGSIRLVPEPYEAPAHRRCTFVKADGRRCRAAFVLNTQYCNTHLKMVDPALAAAEAARVAVDREEAAAVRAEAAAAKRAAKEAAVAAERARRRGAAQ